MKRHLSTVNFAASIFLYVFALLAIIYGIAQITYCYNDVAQALAGGMTVSGNVYTIFDYYMGTCSQSIFWGLLLAAVGWILMQKAFEARTTAAAVIVNEAETFDNEPSTLMGVYANDNDTILIDDDNSNNNDDISKFTED